MYRSALFVILSLFTSVTMAQVSPCATEGVVEPGEVNVGQDCDSGIWYVIANYSYASGRIIASAPLTIIEKLAGDSMFGRLITKNNGKEILFRLDNYETDMTGFRFSAPPGTRVVLVPDYHAGYFSVGDSAPDYYERVNLTDPSVKHLFIYGPQSGQILNKGESSTIEWVSSEHFNRVFISIGRSPSQQSWVRDTSGNQAFYIENTGRFEQWNVLKINSACHDFYLKIGGYANDGTGYSSATSEVFQVLHPYDYGFVCPPISY